MKRNLVYLFFIIVIFMTSCSQNGGTIGDGKPLPEKNMANVFGKVLLANKQPAEGRVVRLAKVYRGENENGTFILDEAKSPSAVSDRDGSFEFLNIDPGEYVLFKLNN